MPRVAQTVAQGACPNRWRRGAGWGSRFNRGRVEGRCRRGELSRALVGLCSRYEALATSFFGELRRAAHIVSIVDHIFSLIPVLTILRHHLTNLLHSILPFSILDRLR